MVYDVAIVGGGAAGLFLAANLERKLKILILEKKSRPARKILVTGGGLCNLSNSDPEDVFLSHFGHKRQANFLKPALRSFSAPATQQWFIDRGLNLSRRPDGKVYPASGKAQSVIDTLLDNLGTNITSADTSPCEKIVYDGSLFALTTPDTSYQAHSVVLATGGMSYPGTGSDGSGYALAKALGHSIVPPAPALTALTMTAYPCTDAAGTSLSQTCIDFFHAGETKPYLKTQGDVLFTHDGLSGPAILNASRFVQKDDRIEIALIPTENKEELRKTIKKHLMQTGAKQVVTLLKDMGLSQVLAGIIMNVAGLDAQIKAAVVPATARTRIIDLLAAFPFIVGSRKGFSSAMVTSGGVNLDEVDRQSMESRICPNLFFCGEILDIDGDTGGYNLQAAFSMAHLCAMSVNRKYDTV